MKCTLCPRNCGADRENTFGVCGAGNKLRIARAALHYWEEPCISGDKGSGTVFFTGCALHCIYCQNREISLIKPGLPDRELPGREIEIPELIGIFYDLLEQGAHNINLVTADHYIPQVAEAVNEAKKQGFQLPLSLTVPAMKRWRALRSLKVL